MKRFLIKICFVIVILSVFLCACKPTDNFANHESSNFDPFNEKFKPVEQIGNVPESLKKVISNNLFKNVVAFETRVLKTDVISYDEENENLTHKITMMDLYGNEISSHVCSAKSTYKVKTLTATSDGGFLFVLGFTDGALSSGGWASDAPFASRIIKCNSKGEMEFDTAFDSVSEEALEYCFEKNDRLYFFGEIQTPETDKKGIHSPTDIFMTVLDKDGTILKTDYISGTDYDDLQGAEKCENGFILSISSQSNNGDFFGSFSDGYAIDWTFTVNDNLEIINSEKKSYRDYFDKRIGEKDGLPVYQSDDFLKDFDIGTPNIFIDYGDFYMIISENPTGIYENTPIYISSIWYYTETVYSAYDFNGNLIFISSVNSSPDYDSIIEVLLDGAVTSSHK